MDGTSDSEKLARCRVLLAQLDVQNIDYADVMRQGSVWAALKFMWCHHREFRRRADAAAADMIAIIDTIGTPELRDELRVLVSRHQRALSNREAV